VYRFVTRNAARSASGILNDEDRQALRKLHQTIRKVTNDFDTRWHFNTSIASLMELVNDFYQLEGKLSGAATSEICEKLTLMLGPFAPFTAQDLWETLGHSGPVFRQTWPSYDEELAKEDLAEIPVQVNGKLRGHLHVTFGTPKEKLERLALSHEKTRPFTDGKQVVRIVVIPDKLVNIVVK
jgi:leucyl-tRNA synthetase